MHSKEELKDITHFLLEYANHLMGSGVHTSRVVRNTHRIGQSLDVEVAVSVIQKNLIVNVRDPQSRESYNEMAATPALPISFDLNAELSALSWDAHDQRLSLDELRERYARAIARPKLHPLCVLLLAALANASFCALFGGDWTSRGIVFAATLVGFRLRQLMQARHINHYIVFIVSALAASLCASSALPAGTPTAEVALATSVLYLVPGVPLLNGVIDIVEGYVTTGVCRLIQALLLVLCIAIGLSVTLMLVRDGLL